MHRTRIAVLAALLAAFPVLAHKGDGTFTDHGARSAHNRFELDFGPVDLERTGSREYRFSDLPAEEFAFGLRLTAPGGEKLGALPAATVRLALVNENGETVFDLTDEVANFVRAETSREWFLYQRGKVPLPGAQKPGQRLSVGPDGGWGTYASPRSGGRYRLTFETVKGDTHLAKFGVRLIAVGGGWK
jgi:hypothetical protein